MRLQTTPEVYSGSAYRCIRLTLHSEGVIRGLYAGTLPSVMANVGEMSTLFMCYEQCQEAVARLSGGNRELRRGCWVGY